MINRETLEVYGGFIYLYRINVLNIFTFYKVETVSLPINFVKYSFKKISLYHV